MSILSRSSELKYPLRNSKKPSPDLMSNKGLSYVREKIRTPDLLVRSQTLYPAELRAHYCVSFLLCPSQQNLLYRRLPCLSTSFSTFFKNFFENLQNFYHDSRKIFIRFLQGLFPVPLHSFFSPAHLPPS